MSKREAYIVTDAAGPRPDIAGRRRTVGEKLRLTESEARFELSRGTIKADPEVVKAAEKKAPKSGDKPAGE